MKLGSHRIINRGKIYLSVDDLMKLMGTERKSTAYYHHQLIRDNIQKGKKNLTIWEYCQYTGDNYQEIFFSLRGSLPEWPPRNKTEKPP